MGFFFIFVPPPKRSQKPLEQFLRFRRTDIVLLINIEDQKVTVSLSVFKQKISLIAEPI